jgi:hypothetical protein
LGVGAGVGLCYVGAENSGNIGLVKDEGGMERDGKSEIKIMESVNPQWNLSHKIDGAEAYINLK